MTKTNEFERLAEITGAGMDHAQARMKRLLAEEANIREQLASLQASRHQFSPQGSAAHSVSADVKWQVWIDHRREELNLELARIFVKKDAARAQLKRAFGKDQTVQALLKKQRLAKLLDHRRQVS